MILMRIIRTLLITLFSVVATVEAVNNKEMTLFVHGTKFPGIDIKREFFGGLIPKGLHCATELTKAYHPHEVITALCTGTHTFTAKKDLYFFGWDGLWPTNREQEAQKLFDALQALINTTEMETLHIRCVTHSHGGSIMLYLVNLIDTHNAPIVIDELVLMGCPIQQMTEKYAHSATIKKIFNLYSNGDDIQQSDPQGLYPEARQNGERPPLMSRRTFTKKRDNLWEIAIRVDGKKIGHQEFIDHMFLLSITQIIEQAKQHPASPLQINVVTNENIKPIERVNLRIQK